MELGDIFSEGIEVFPLEPLDENIFRCNVQIIEINEREVDSQRNYEFYKHALSAIGSDRGVKTKAKMHEEKMLHLATIVVEAASALPTLGETLPANDSIRSFQKARVLPKEKKINNIPIVSTQGQIGIFCPNTILDANFSEHSEIVLSNSDHLLDSMEQTEHGNIMKICSASNFVLEEEYHFPMSRSQFPEIIERIESHLNCDKIFSFRCAFGNVFKDIEMEDDSTRHWTLKQNEDSTV